LQDIQQKSEKILEMSAVMYQAVNTEDCTNSSCDVIAQLEQENQAMRKLLQLELLHFDQSTPSETQKTPSTDVAIQTTRSSPDESPFCTADFATIKLRPSSTGTPASTAECTADKDVQNSLYQQNADNEETLPKFSTSSVSEGNSEQTIFGTPDLNGGVCLSAAVSEVGGTWINNSETERSTNSSDSLETLVDTSDLAANDENL